MKKERMITAVCAIGATVAFLLSGCHTGGTQTGNGANSVGGQTISGTQGSDYLQDLTAEGYEQEAIVAAAVSYMDENAQGKSGAKMSKTASAAAVKVTDAHTAVRTNVGSHARADDSVYFYPASEVTFLKGFEFTVTTQTESFLTEKCGKGELRIIVAEFTTDTIWDETLFCAIGEKGSYFCLINGGSYEYLVADYQPDYETGPNKMTKAELNFSGHKRIANGMIIKDFSHWAEQAKVVVSWTKTGISCSLATELEKKNDSEETYPESDSGWNMDVSAQPSDGGRKNDALNDAYTTLPDSYKQTDVSQIFDLSECAAEYLVVRLTAAPATEIKTTNDANGQSEEMIIGYMLPAVYGIFDKNGDFYEIPCRIYARVGIDGMEPENLTENSILKVYFSDRQNLYDENGDYLMSLTASQICRLN